MYRDWKQIDEMILEQYPSHGSPPIMRAFSMSRSAICRRAKKLGIMPPGKPRSSKRINWEQIDEAICREYPLRGSLPIMQAFGLPRSTVCRRVKALGIVSLAFSEGRSDGRSDCGDQRNAFKNHDYFKTWSPNMAWLLGYSWTDATIERNERRIKFRCSARDIGLLHAIKSELGGDGTISTYFPKIKPGALVKKSGEMAKFTVSSKVFVGDIIRHGVVPNKSNIDPPMPDIPDKYLCHFVRGVIDGDGTICESPYQKTQSGVEKTYTARVINILGSHRFVETIRHRIAECSGVPLRNRLRNHSSDKLSVIAWNSVADLIPLIQWLYPEGEYLALERKRATAARMLTDMLSPKPLVIPELILGKNGYAAVFFESDKFSLGKVGSNNDHVARYQRVVEAIRNGVRGDELKLVARSTAKSDRVKQVKHLGANGLSYTQISRTLGISLAQVWRDLKTT